MPFKNLINPDNVEAWSDYSSLKAYLERRYGHDKIRMSRTILSQTGTAGAVEWEEKAGETIAQIGKAEVTMTLSGDADNASTNGKVYTLVYKTSAGTSKTCAATGTATLNGTPVAFVPACTDFYEPVSFSASAADANVNVTLLSGGVTYGTIATTATSALDASLYGIGSVNFKQKTDQVGTDGGIVATLEYVNHLGIVKTCAVALNAVNTTTEVRPIDTTTGLTVKDFFRLRDFSFAKATADEVLLVAVGGAAVYGAIKVAYDHAIFTRYMCPAGRRAFIAKICGTVSTNTYMQLAINFTPYGHTIANTVTLNIPQDTPFNVEPLLEMAANTECYFTILGNTAIFCGDLIILEIEV